MDEQEKGGMEVRVRGIGEEKREGRRKERKKGKRQAKGK